MSLTTYSDFCNNYPGRAGELKSLTEHLSKFKEPYSIPLICSITGKTSNSVQLFVDFLCVNTLARWHHGRKHEADECDGWTETNGNQPPYICVKCGQSVAEDQSITESRFSLLMIDDLTSEVNYHNMIFLSYASDEGDTHASIITTLLRNNGYSVYDFRQPERLQINWQRAQDYAAFHCKCFIVIQTPSYRDRPECLNEFHYANLNQRPFIWLTSEVAMQTLPDASLTAINPATLLHYPYTSDDSRLLTDMDWKYLVDTAVSLDKNVNSATYILRKLPVPKLRDIAQSIDLHGQYTNQTPQSDLIDIIVRRAFSDRREFNRLKADLSPSIPDMR